MPLPVSPLARPLPPLPPIAGCDWAPRGRHPLPGPHDLVFAEFPVGTTVAGVFTRNVCPGAPIDWCGRRSRAAARALVVNAGNANVFTGRAGAEAAKPPPSPPPASSAAR